MITVSKNGGDLSSVQEAIDSIPSGNETVFIRKGIYHERVEITVPGVTLIGESAEETVIEYGLYAMMKADDARKLGTFRSYTMLVNADDVICRGITVRNTAGFGKDIGQAVALYAEGDRLTFEDCRICGRQDTLFTGPLPPTEREKGGFRGPTEFSERKQGRQIYRKCHIEGDVDFIFGSAAARFEDCVIHSLDRGEEINGYVTASSACEGAESGYVFERCRFTGDCAPHSVYLGRPWREFAQVSLINCEIGQHIRPEFFCGWNNDTIPDTVRFEVIGCTY